MENGLKIPRDVYKRQLLECMSNLLANEMFGTGEEDTAETADEEEIIREIEEGVENLASQTDHLVIVTNEIFSDGIKYQDCLLYTSRCV